QALGNQGRSTEQPPAGIYPADMQRPVTRVILVAMALFGFIPGAWAAIAPESFYWDFPKIRSAWVSSDGPYNEHLLRDIGAFFLALGVLALIAAISGRLLAARLAGAAWLVFGTVHAAYHFSHLHVYSESIDQWLNVVSMVGSIAMAVAVLIIPGRRNPNSTNN
ncbi:MAG: hypothetical protein ABWZ98_16230, partial [Nakamurella sp.]